MFKEKIDRLIDEVDDKVQEDDETYESQRKINDSILNVLKEISRMLKIK